MDNEVNNVRQMSIQGDINNIQERKPEIYKSVPDGKNKDRVGTSEHACTSPRCNNTSDINVVEELTVRNSNTGKLEIVASKDSDAGFFSEFLDNKQEDLNQSQSQNEITENSPQPSPSNSLLSPGGIRTKILSKSGFSEYFVKSTLTGKGITFRGPAHTRGAVVESTTTPRETSVLHPKPSVSLNNDSVSLREWMNSGKNKVDKSRCLYIFKQILDLVDSSHSRGVPLQALRPLSFRLLPLNQISYLPTMEFTETEDKETQFSKKRKHVENRNSFGRWPQFPNRSGDSKAQVGGSRASGVVIRDNMIHSNPNISNMPLGVSSFGRDLLEEQWYASPEELREKCSTLSSNIYSLGVLLFELLGSFESSREHAIAMMNLRQRILPPNFLSENPKEAGYCLWLLHPEASARPTTRDILNSKLVSGIVQISTDELLSSIDKEDTESELLLHFLDSVKEQKQKHATKLIQDLNCLESDIAEVESRRSITSLPFTIKQKQSHESRLMKNLTHLESAYFYARSCIENEPTDSENQEKKPFDRLGMFFNGLCKYARYSKFEVRGNLRSGDFSSSANVICSLGFDRDEDYFATAGVSKKIKVYDFHLLLDDSVDIHYPAIEMPNKSKLTYICWNSYIKNYLASTDYDGIVKLWDVGSGQAISHHIEHERRAWSVDFSRVDPTKLVSGGDDCYVKLWSINEKKSLSTIRNIANVCCVQFSPYSSHLLSFGSADYRTYCYDLRNISTPLCILAGHDRAVSYVKFLDPETIVSASTDNTLKLWDLKKTSFGRLSSEGCILTLRGHTNEKNFVGLSVADGYIACGSETNEVFAYHRSLPMPITSHKFGSVDPVSGKETDHGNNQFVSSVCWRQKSEMVIAANSSGCLKLLQMV